MGSKGYPRGLYSHADCEPSGCSEQDRRSDLLSRYIGTVQRRLERFNTKVIWDENDPEGMVQELIYAATMHTRSLDDA